MTVSTCFPGKSIVDIGPPFVSGMASTSGPHPLTEDSPLKIIKVGSFEPITVEISGTVLWEDGRRQHQISEQ